MNIGTPKFLEIAPLLLLMRNKSLQYFVFDEEIKIKDEIGKQNIMYIENYRKKYFYKF